MRPSTQGASIQRGVWLSQYRQPIAPRECRAHGKSRTAFAGSGCVHRVQDFQSRSNAAPLPRPGSFGSIPCVRDAPARPVRQFLAKWMTRNEFSRGSPHNNTHTCVFFIVCYLILIHQSEMRDKLPNETARTAIPGQGALRDENAASGPAKLGILVINLDRSPRRLAAMASQLDRMGLEWERFAATDGNALGKDAAACGYSPSLNRKQYPRNLNAGEIGCFVSHRRAWQYVLAKGWDGAVILEDDVRLSGELPAAIDALQHAWGRWDAVKFIGCGRKTLCRAPLGLDNRLTLGYYIKTPVHTGAQAITAQSAQKLLGSTQTFGRPVDVALQWWWETGVRFQGLEPDLATPGGFASDIDYNCDRMKAPRRRWLRLKQTVIYNAIVFKNAISLICMR